MNIETKFTPGPWTAFALVHEGTNEPMTPEQVGEYVCNSVKKSAQASGSQQFLFISAQLEDGRPADVCHVGNGPNRANNARLIAAAPDMYALLRAVVDAGMVPCDEEACGCLGVQIRDVLASLETPVREPLQEDDPQ